VTDLRAILVSREQCRALYETSSLVGDTLAAAADAAGDQPRKKVCATHPHHSLNFDLPCDGGYDDCRVVDAIVVPLPEQP
jgi:hypothetical protein